MVNKIVGGNILIVGDLHFSDVFTGQHKNYLGNCMGILGTISKKVADTKPSAVVLLGDIIGWSETNIRDRQVLSLFCKELRDWNSICPVFSVRGNHDIKGYPDFLFLSEFGLIQTSESCGGYFDYYGFEEQEIPEVRFHLVDYGSEDRELQLADGETSNVVLGHNNYTIEGVTNWYAEHDGIELGMLQNFSGVSMVISGHIHNPSPDFVSTKMPNGQQCLLFYTGCPTRPIREKNLYETCWYVNVKYNESIKQTDITPEVFELPPIDEVFHKEEEYAITAETTEEEETRKENLKNVLDELLKFRVSTGDPFEQVDNIPNGSDEAKKVAKDYLSLAFNGTK